MRYYFLIVVALFLLASCSDPHYESKVKMVKVQVDKRNKKKINFDFRFHNANLPTHKAEEIYKIIQDSLTSSNADIVVDSIIVKKESGIYYCHFYYVGYAVICSHDWELFKNEVVDVGLD